MKNKTLIAWIVAAVVVMLLVYGSYVNSAPPEAFKQVSTDVRQNPTTGEVLNVVYFLKTRFLKNPDSYESVKWFQMTKRKDGGYEVRHRFKCKTPEGEPNDPVTILFTLNEEGEVVGYR